MPPKVIEQLPKVYLKVPFSDKDEAKALGARWDAINKMWWITSKEQSKFSKWQTMAPPPNSSVNATKAAATTSVAPPVVPQLAPELAQALGNKKEYTLVTPADAAPDAPPIPCLMAYKLKEKSTADLAKVIAALGVALPLGLDVDELIDILRMHPTLIKIDDSPPPPVTFKPLREITEHELIMQRIKAKKEADERAAKRKNKEEVIEPERGIGHQVVKKTKSSAPRDKEKQLTEEQREILARIEDDDYTTIR